MKKILLFLSVVAGLFASNIDIQPWQTLKNGLICLTQVNKVLVQNVYSSGVLDSVKVVNNSKDFTKKECKIWKKSINDGYYIVINFIDDKKVITILLNKKICNGK